MQLEELSKLKHPNIIKLYGSCTSNLHCYIVTGIIIIIISIMTMCTYNLHDMYNYTCTLYMCILALDTT